MIGYRRRAFTSDCSVETGYQDSIHSRHAVLDMHLVLTSDSVFELPRTLIYRVKQQGVIFFIHLSM